MLRISQASTFQLQPSSLTRSHSSTLGVTWSLLHGENHPADCLSGMSFIRCSSRDVTLLWKENKKDKTSCESWVSPKGERIECCRLWSFSNLSGEPMSWRRLLMFRFLLYFITNIQDLRCWRTIQSNFSFADEKIWGPGSSDFPNDAQFIKKQHSV